MPSKAVSLALSSHPGPAIAVTIITVGLGFAVGLAPIALVFLSLSMLAGQISIGLSNDWIDAERDKAAGRQDKPISRGWIAASSVRTAAWIAAALTVILAIPLGWAAGITLVVAVALAWAYNAGLKKTPFSIVPYILSFGALPAIATLALVPPHAPAPWALGVGGLLGAAGHFANTLPDIEDDRAAGVRGLPQRLGPRRSSILTYAVLLLAAVLEILGAGGFGFVPADIGLVLNLIICGVGISIINRPTRWHFRLIILAALLDAVVLLFAGPRLLA
jgi:4-hydroxybenzoate polyprenyltransferase